MEENDRPDPAGTSPRTIIVDGANVVGSRPDGWWRDRAAAAAALHERLVEVAARHLDGDHIVLVLEGAARAALRGIDPNAAGVRAVAAPGSGDDEIVRLVGLLPGRRLVVTADRALRRRCRDAGAEVVGPAWLHALSDSTR